MTNNIYEFHEDADSRIENERHAGLILTAGKLVLIHRRKPNLEYYVLPGGHRRNKEGGKRAVLREIFEETNLKCSVVKLLLEIKDYGHQVREFYYFCRPKNQSTLVINGEENIRNNRDNFFEPLWIEFGSIDQLNLVPKWTKDWLIENRDYLNNLQ